MEIGSFIKLQRVKKGMTQEELAEGIVSMSYLSKIENLRAEASPEVVSMLCTRLGIDLDGDQTITIKEKCEEWFNMLFDASDKNEMIDKYNELNELLAVVRSDSLMLFEIHKIRYFLILGEYDNALEQINSLNELSGNFDNLQMYYWYKFKGNYATTSNEYNQSLRMYNLAEGKISYLNLPDSEIADLYYVISVTHSTLLHTLEAIEYADKAIEIFQKEYNFLRCAQCHIILGISYRRIKMYQKAIKHYNLARHLGELNKNNNVIQLTNQNLGYLYAVMGESKQAIKYYLQAIDDDSVGINERLIAITNLIKEYYKLQNFDKALEIIEQAKVILSQARNSVFYDLYYYIIHSYIHAINGDYEKFTTLVTEDLIPYLKKHKDHANLILFSKMLAKHFEDVGRYKDSVKYYKLANLTFEEVVNL